MAVKSAIPEAARGKWPKLLEHFGVSCKRKRHGPCPICGGKDRFIFDDKEGMGTFHCNHCGAGTGFTLLSKVKGWSMSQTMREVAKVAGGFERMETKPEMTDAERKKALNDLWKESRVSAEGDPVQRYIAQRTGLLTVPGAIRFHPELYHPETRSNHAGMIAKITSPDHLPVSIHRTFLTPTGEKAQISRSKMLMPGPIPDGSAIRLFTFTDTLGIAEGIETAISCFALFGIPTWAAVSAAMLVKWEPPETVQKVYIFGDNDQSFTGQLAAYRLGWRLRNNSKYEIVQVMIPDVTGADWNDILTIHGTQNAKELYKLK
jgi:putative DNA primase/helicase